MLIFKNDHDQGLNHDDPKNRTSQSAISRSLRNRTIAREKLIAIIEQELKEDLRRTPSVNQLAESFYVSPRTLSRRL
ncbi:MAG: hypothetical protein VXZ35_03775, partial [Pseudomonadota bacterium]|nr:hypothetical protein [Pseudomonadota bacterium]